METTVADPETGESTTSVILNHRYLYRGYLQIAALDLTRTTLNALWYILWDQIGRASCRERVFRAV